MTQPQQTTALAPEQTYEPFTHEHYRHILRTAANSGYRFICYPERHSIMDSLKCLLRHDCDNDLHANLQMARIEAEMGIRSTYFFMLRSVMYNLLSPPNRKLAHEIMELGHEIGLHFDEPLHPQLPSEQVSRLVDRERHWLGQELDIEVETVSFHIPSHRVLANEIKLNCTNTYDHQDLHGYHYISDSNMTWYEGCPSHLFEKRTYPHLHILIHSEWWTEKPMDMQQKWNVMFSNNWNATEQVLLERERKYQARPCPVGEWKGAENEC